MLWHPLNATKAQGWGQRKELVGRLELPPSGHFSIHRIRKSWKGNADESLLLLTSCESWKKPMPAPNPVR